MGNVILATRTMEAINSALEADQGASFRGWLGKVMPHMGDAYSTNNDPFRPHLGASTLGDECERKIWYGFRWATRSRHKGQLLRLFNRGHLEEARFIALILMIGCQVYQQDENGKQFRINFADGHGGGSGDGIVLGIPDLPEGMPAVSEFKTHNDKSFQKLKAEGVREAKFEHYVQMTLYMRKMSIGAALYMAVNKNNDEIYAEIIYLNKEMGDEFIDRGTRIVWAKSPPPKISKTPGFFKCKWCDHNKVCHQPADNLPDRNCRTCGYSEPLVGAVWYCHKHGWNLTRERQFTGCEDWDVNEVFKA